MSEEKPIDAYVIFTNEHVPCFLSHWSEQEAWDRAAWAHPKDLLRQCGWYCRRVCFEILDKPDVVDKFHYEGER